MNSDLTVRPVEEGEREWLAEVLRKAWGPTVVSRGRVIDPTVLPAVVCLRHDRPVGVATYDPGSTDCELVTIDAFREHTGVGSALLSAVEEAARSLGCSRLWLITTNDNLDALRFYQRRGMRIAAVHAGAIEVSRALKPSISMTGCYGIEIRDELELEKCL
jgi:ribosomal protein S18 acetylase RimI-like enzyme